MSTRPGGSGAADVLAVVAARYTSWAEILPGRAAFTAPRPANRVLRTSHEHSEIARKRVLRPKVLSGQLGSNLVINSGPEIGLRAVLGTPHLYAYEIGRASCR